MKHLSFLFSVVALISCSSDNATNDTSMLEQPLYGSEILKNDDNGQGPIKVAFWVHPDTIKQHGAKDVLLRLVGAKCESGCYADLWDDKAAFQLNSDNPYGKRTDAWQKQHYAFIADHLVSTKMSANDDDMVNYPLTYDSNYKRWGGKMKH